VRRSEIFGCADRFYPPLLELQMDEGSSYGFWPQHPKISQSAFALTGIPLLLNLSA